MTVTTSSPVINRNNTQFTIKLSDTRPCFSFVENVQITPATRPIPEMHPRNNSELPKAKAASESSPKFTSKYKTETASTRNMQLASTDIIAVETATSPEIGSCGISLRESLRDGDVVMWLVLNGNNTQKSLK